MVFPCSWKSRNSSKSSYWCAISKNVVGSSNSMIGVCCANNIAIHTRWRCPPDNSETNLPDISVRRVADKASATACSSLSSHCRNKLWYGARPRATRSATRIPSGAVEDCGNNPNCCATCLAGRSVIAVPSSKTWPSEGVSTREQARSNVDLPQPFGPMMAVKD